MLRKVLLVLVLVIFVAGLTGCTLRGEEKKDFNFYEFKIGEEQLAKEVTGWNVYINPVWRYRVRMPMGWKIQKADESGQVVDFWGEEKRQLIIQAVENFETHYDLEAYMKSVGKQEFLSGYYESLPVDVGGEKGTLIKKTPTETGEIVDLLLIVFEDRIFNIHIWNSNEDMRTLLNSLEFYEGGGYNLE